MKQIKIDKDLEHMDHFNMISLSIYNGHNAAICIIKDGVVFWELERFSRIKHDYGFNLDFLLDICNLKLKDIDVIITNKQDYGRKPPWDVPSTDKSDCVSFKINETKAFALNHHFAMYHLLILLHHSKVQL